MSLETRKKWTGTAAKAILILVVLDLVAYAAAARYLTGVVASEQDRFNTVRLEWWREKRNLALLEKRAGALPGRQRQMEAFLTEHVSPRREAFSRAATLVEQLSQQSQVQLIAVKYSPAEAKGEPLSHLSFETNVEGSFENLLNFAHALETSNDFLVVRSFKFAAESQGVLGLHVNADLYLMP